MATHHKNLSTHNPADIPSLPGKKIGIVVSEYNTDITSALLAGARETLLKYGISAADITVSFVPGSYELPLGAQFHIDHHKCDAMIVLGCVITGETKHDEYISHAVSQGIMQLGLFYKKPFIFGLLTPLNKEQAMDRAGGKHGNKGVEAAVAALKMLALKNIAKNTPALGFK